MEGNVALIGVKDNLVSMNDEKQRTIDAILSFVNPENSLDFFILKGAAGTGKTTLIDEVINNLQQPDFDFVLLAPTGRAARVLAKKTGKNVKTLHSYLYKTTEIRNNDDNIIRIEFIPKSAFPVKPVILIVDESSMVSDKSSNNDVFISKTSVLHDLINFYRHCPVGSKLIFAGDDYQLPPVDEDGLSPALSKDYLFNRYGLTGITHKILQVHRQHPNSYILQNARMLRLAMDNDHFHYNNLKCKNLYKPELALRQYKKLYDPDDNSKVVFIGWKNRTIHKLNKTIRTGLHKRHDLPLVENEQIILNRSFYRNCFIPNGETGKVVEYYRDKIEKIGENIFGEAKFQFQLCSGGQIELVSKFCLDYLLSDDISENPTHANLLWADRYRKNKIFRESQNPADDPYLSALKIRYGYAITTHKAQGGEWDHVFLYPEFPGDNNRLRWIYTAVTRAKTELYSF